MLSSKHSSHRLRVKPGIDIIPKLPNFLPRLKLDINPLLSSITSHDLATVNHQTIRRKLRMAEQLLQSGSKSAHPG
jgi:hypothetical protein